MAVQVFRHRQLKDAFYETFRSSGPLEEVGFRPWHNVRATSLQGIVGLSNLHASSTAAFGMGFGCQKTGDLTQQRERVPEN
jgi:hypothetical protein